MIRKLLNRISGPVRVLLLGLLALTLVGIVISTGNGGDEQAPGPKLEVREVQDPEHAADDYEVIVPAERIPENMDQRLSAAAIALIPNHAGFPEARGEVTVSPAEERRIKGSLERALQSWETYLPRDGYRDRYRKKMAPLTVPEALLSISERRDSNDAPGVCPQTSCRIGSRWYRPGAISSFLIDLEGSRAYLVAYGAIVYRGDKALGATAAGSSERAYGVIMRQDNGQWLLERIAAESLR
jgi:hypothetical protein